MPGFVKKNDGCAHVLGKRVCRAPTTTAPGNATPPIPTRQPDVACRRKPSGSMPAVPEHSRLSIRATASARVRKRITAGTFPTRGVLSVSTWAGPFRFGYFPNSKGRLHGFRPVRTAFSGRGPAPGLQGAGPRCAPSASMLSSARFTRLAARSDPGAAICRLKGLHRCPTVTSPSTTSAS